MATDPQPITLREFAEKIVRQSPDSVLGREAAQALNMSGAELSDKRVYCSFCGKDDRDVEIMLTAPRVAICNNCVDICNILITAIREKKQPECEQPSPPAGEE